MMKNIMKVIKPKKIVRKEIPVYTNTYENYIEREIRYQETTQSVVDRYVRAQMF